MSLEDLVSKQDKIMNYIKQDDETARKLAEAKGNISKIATVLKQASTDDFIQGIVDSPQYASFTLDVADKIMSDHPKAVQETQDKLLGLKTKQKPKKAKKKYVKKYKSKTASGKTYKKGYKKWQNVEVTFLKSRKNKTATEVYKEYSQFFNEQRSKSSVITKFYRVRK